MPEALRKSGIPPAAAVAAAFAVLAMTALQARMPAAPPSELALTGTVISLRLPFHQLGDFPALLARGLGLALLALYALLWEAPWPRRLILLAALLAVFPPVYELYAYPGLIIEGATALLLFGSPAGRYPRGAPLLIAAHVCPGGALLVPAVWLAMNARGKSARFFAGPALAAVAALALRYAGGARGWNLAGKTVLELIPVWGQLLDLWRGHPLIFVPLSYRARIMGTWVFASACAAGLLSLLAMACLPAEKRAFRRALAWLIPCGASTAYWVAFQAHGLRWAIARARFPVAAAGAAAFLVFAFGIRQQSVLISEHRQLQEKIRTGLAQLGFTGQRPLLAWSYSEALALQNLPEFSRKTLLQFPAAAFGSTPYDFLRLRDVIQNEAAIDRLRETLRATGAILIRFVEPEETVPMLDNDVSFRRIYLNEEFAAYVALPG